MRSINMRIISENIKYCTVIMLFVLSNILSQEIGSPWIDVRGRYEHEQNEILSESIPFIEILFTIVLFDGSRRDTNVFRLD